MNFTLDFSLEEIRNVHFIGIGGIGMSGIARLMLAAGFKVSGSDLNDSEITRGLKAEGAEIFAGHKAANIGACDIVVVSSNPLPTVVVTRRFIVLTGAGTRPATSAIVCSIRSTTVSGP